MLIDLIDRLNRLSNERRVTTNDEEIRRRCFTGEIAIRPCFQRRSRFDLRICYLEKLGTNLRWGGSRGANRITEGKAHGFSG
jgi:hypothetical protein